MNQLNIQAGKKKSGWSHGEHFGFTSDDTTCVRKGIWGRKSVSTIMDRVSTAQFSYHLKS
ncbi:MAG: hypothetical protein SOZ94_10405 [Prevotella sp.]|nr:hypothetical protein [Prevotella sp.]